MGLFHPPRPCRSLTHRMLLLPAGERSTHWSTHCTFLLLPGSKSTHWSTHRTFLLLPGEWSRLPAQEKEEVRSAILGLLFSEASDRVALQIALLAANVARFDFPGKWPNLLAELSNAAQWRGQDSAPRHWHALVALKHVVRALRNKRIVVEQPPMLLGIREMGLRPCPVLFIVACLLSLV